MPSTTDSDARQKPLVGLRIIEAWCWLWAILWAGSAITIIITEHNSADFSPSMVFPLLLGVLPLGSFNGPEGPTDVAGVMLCCAVIAMIVAVGFRRRKRWARDLTQSGAFLNLLNSGFSAPAFWLAVHATENSGMLGWLTIRLVALFHVANVGSCAWIVWHLSQPEFKEISGGHERAFCRLPSWVLLVVLAVVAALTIYGLLFWGQ